MTTLPTPRLDDLIAAIGAAHPDVLDRLAEAMLAADHLGEVADHLVGHFVDQARRSGASWTEIGARLGVTKQAARKRFLPGDPGVPDDSVDLGTSMFATFTARARGRVVEAMDDARQRHHAEVTPAHLLHALAGQPVSVAMRVLDQQGVGPDDLRARAGAALADVVPGDAAPGPVVPYDVATRKVLELSLREALRLGHPWVGTEHLLLALLEEEHGAGPLADLGVTKERSEALVVEMLAVLADAAD